MLARIMSLKKDLGTLNIDPVEFAKFNYENDNAVLISVSPIPLDQDHDADIRANWAQVLAENALNAEDIAPAICWGFSADDCKEFLNLYKLDFFKFPINALLEDCNFHTLNELLTAHKYEDAANYINNEL
jgi:hypothetical protein